MPTLIQKCIAELFGTFVLTFCACGCAGGTNFDVTPTSLAFGLTLVVMIYSIGKISGCHINPAVSIAFLILGELSGSEFIGYVVSQFIGGLIGSICVFGFIYMSLKGQRKGRMANLYNTNESAFGNASNNILNYPIYGYEVGSVFGGLLTEIVLTFIYVYVFICVTAPGNPDGNLAGLIIGGTLTLVHLVGICITGTSVNPARSFATGITEIIYFDMTGSLKQIWIWFLGPMLGGILAPFFYQFLHDRCPTNAPIIYPQKSGENSSQTNSNIEMNSYTK